MREFTEWLSAVKNVLVAQAMDVTALPPVPHFLAEQVIDLHPETGMCECSRHKSIVLWAPLSILPNRIGGHARLLTSILLGIMVYLLLPWIGDLGIVAPGAGLGCRRHLLPGARHLDDAAL